MPPAHSRPARGGKQAADEDFPVASWFLPASLRGAVLDFYRFARKADDIADNPVLSAEQKLARLATLSPPDAHGALLLKAFRQDAVRQRYPDWPSLMAYCRMSAVPVGDKLLDLHGEGEWPRAAAAALCTALQILNHVQDCGADYRLLGRVYLPQELLGRATVEDLAAEACSPALRAAIDAVLYRTAILLEEARPLPPLIMHRGLRLQAAITFAVAERQLAMLRRRDPLAQRLRLSRWDRAATLMTGLWRGFLC